MATTEHPQHKLRAWMLEGLSDMGKDQGKVGPRPESQLEDKG